MAAYYLPQADLAADPVLASPGLVAADLQLLPGAGWRALPYTTHTLKLEETPKTERGVTTYQVRATAQRPQPSPDVLATLASLDRRPLLLLLVEAGGGRRLVGSREEYVLLSTTGEGQHPGTKSGLELRFEGAATRRAPWTTTGAITTYCGIMDQSVRSSHRIKQQLGLGTIIAAFSSGSGRKAHRSPAVGGLELALGFDGEDSMIEDHRAHGLLGRELTKA